MLLVIDVGNTNMVFGLFEGENLTAVFRQSTEMTRTADEIGLTTIQFFAHFGYKLSDVEGVVVASVAPQVMYTLTHAIRKYMNTEPLVIQSCDQTGLHNLCPEPLGIDRALTLVAAMEKYGKPLIVIDFGTATKVDSLNAEGAYLGGVIAPGIKISMEALFANAAKLPRIEIVGTQRVIGTDTVSQMQAGALYGFVGSIEHIVSQMKREMGGDAVPVVATGGLSVLIADHTEVIETVDRNLTLEGLRLVWRRIQG